MINIMLCGAGDVNELLPPFKEVANEIGFNPLNYTDGTILYHNYGINRWERNSRLTVNSSDILLFVINERYGQITWSTELDEANINGKNFIILCRDETYKNYRFFKDQRLEYPTNLDQNKKDLYILIDRIENTNQLSVIPFNIFDFKTRVKEHLMTLFKFALSLTEKENQRNSFLPVLMSSRYNNLLLEHVNTKNEKICREILFDFFENKEMRKRALEYFKYSKSLSDEDITELSSDMEQGLKRKTLVMLPELLGHQNNLNVIFEDIITNIANDDDVGLIRRAIKTLSNVNLELSIRYFGLLFPAADVGTPKRIISVIKERENEIDDILLVKPDLTDSLINLVNACINYNNDKTDWKSIANDLLNKYKTGK